MQTAPLLNLSGMATKADEYIAKRSQLNDVFERELQKQTTRALSEAAASKAVTPIAKARDPKTALVDHFNAKNEHLGIIYS